MNKFISYIIIGLSVITASCKTAETKDIEYVTEPITEIQTNFEQKSLPNQNKLIKGEWVIIKASGKSINDLEERAYINFNALDGKIYGYTGCNYINGNFSVDGNTNLRITDIITTAKECDAINEERSIIEGLNNASSFSIYKKDGLYYLDIKSADGKTAVHAKRHNADVLTGTWKVTAIEKKPVDNDRLRLVIDIPELKLHGEAGCNIINGTIGLDRNKDWFIQFQSIASTKRACDGETMSLERNLLIALEEVEYIQRLSFNEIKLQDKNRNEVLTLKRIEIKLNK